MLEQIFLHVLNMTFVGSFVILFVLVARLLLKKSPKKYSYLLWIVVLFRLIVPFSVKSVLSLIPVNPTPIVWETIYSATPQITTGIPNVDQSINAVLPVIRDSGTGNPMLNWILFAALLWVLGVAFYVIFGAVSLNKTKNSIKNAVHWKDNVYRSKEVKIPFVLGLVKPRIYMPDNLSQSEEEYILLHEQTHIKRMDHVIRILSYFVLALHWFNPLVWIAFWRSGDDMEMSCDESVINTLGYSLKKDYSQSLLNFATGKKSFGISPLAFGEGNTKGRIINILSYKKPRFYIMLTILVMVIPLAIGLLLNPKYETGDAKMNIVVDSVFKSIGDEGLKHVSELGNLTIVGKTMTDKGIKVTISEVFYDGVRLSVGYVMEGNRIGEIEELDFLVNDTLINTGMSFTGSLINNNTYAGIITANPTNEFPKEFRLAIRIEKIGTARGHWVFEDITVINQSQNLNFTVITPMITKPLRGGSITIEKFQVSESTIKLEVIESHKPKGTVYDYQVLDNYGNVLEPLSGRGQGEDGLMKMEFTYEPLYNNPEHFIVRILAPESESPILVEDVKVIVTNQFPIILSQGEGGQISVNKIEYLEDKTLVYYTYQGNAPFTNGMSIWLESNSGKKLNKPTEAIQRNKDGSFILECLPTDPNKEISIGTKTLPDIKEILEFEIPLKE